jgi:uncharacterized protein (TIGR03437 family)
MSRPFFLCFVLAFATFGFSNAQPILTCNETAVPPVVKGEGIAERTGDIVLNCSGGAAGAHVTGNLSIFLTVNITNRVTGSTVNGVVFTIDNGSGPQPVNVPGIIAGPNTLVYNGVNFTLSSTGTATLRIANIRAAANQLDLSPNISIQAFLGFNSSLVSLTNSVFSVGTPLRGLYAGFSTSLVCVQKGSPLPDNLKSLASFLTSGAAFASTRFTEGFADAFSQRSAWESLNADSGTRFLVTYSGFPQGARLFVPDVIAGSDAITPTGAGDFGVPASGGRYAPGGAGSLLLSRVLNTDANGAGGAVVYTPGPSGSGAVSPDSMNEVVLNNGSGIAVYEVMDANPAVQENAQFPTFLGLAPFSGDPIVTNEVVSLAPVSTVTVATAHDPIPRFQALPPPADCSIVGDCGAFFFPRLFVNTTPLSFTAQSGGNFQVGYTQVNNRGGGHLVWVATISYTNGSGWLQLDPANGIDNATIRVEALPTNLTPGTYQAILTVDGGPQAGSITVPITFVVTAQPSAPPPPTVTSIVNAGTFAAGPAVPGSISTLMGAQLAGKNVVVGFDGSPARILFDSNTQINVVVPAVLGTKASSQLVVVVDGTSSLTQTVPLAAFGPGIFKGGVLNQDGSANATDHPAHLPSVLQIFATGLSGNGQITARINGAVIDSLEFGGPAPGLAGVQQVNLKLPTGLTGSSAEVSVCGGIPGKPDQAVCSPTVQVAITQ